MKRVGLSPKQKFMLLIGGVLAFLLLSYYLSLRKTLTARSQYQVLVQQEELIRSLDDDLNKWKILNFKIDRQLGGNIALSGFHENLLNVVGPFCESHNLVLSEFSEPFEGADGGYRIETIVLRIEGNYKPLLQLAHHLETNFKGGKLSSIEFVKEKDFRRNREDLFLKLYVQKIRRDENL